MKYNQFIVGWDHAIFMQAAGAKPQKELTGSYKVIALNQSIVWIQNMLWHLLKADQLNANQVKGYKKHASE